jgi:YD repeat-containing protein
LLCFIAALLGWSAIALAGSVYAASASRGVTRQTRRTTSSQPDASVLAEETGASSLGGPLVIPLSPIAGEEMQAADEANLTSPGAVAARETSRTRYEHEDQTSAVQTLREAFPAVVNRQDGGPQPLAAGEKSLGFKSANVEQVDTGFGYFGVVQSLAPVAVDTGDGHWAAVNLTPQETTSGFEPQRPLVAVRIPKHLAEGARIPGIGVSLTPVDADGHPLSGSDGVTDGMGVLFANTQADADTLLKPSSFGLEASTVLRSVASPEALYYRVGVPHGARLVASPAGPGAEVVNEGVAVARIKPPVAIDAAGTPVPASMSVSGDTVIVSVKHDEGSYAYPIVVDPELAGYWQEWSNVVPGNWEFHEWVGYTYEIAGAELRMKHEPGSFQTNDYAVWSEKTKGYTKIFDVYVKDELYPWSSPDGHSRDTPSWLEAFIETYKPGVGTENWTELTGSPYRSEATVCGAAGCASAEGTNENNAFAFELTTRNAGSTGEQFYAHAEQVSTGVAQQYGKHSTVGYNTTSGEIEGTPNVMAGSGKWLGPHTGKLEFHSEDGGLGVSEHMVEVKGAAGWEKVSGINWLPTGSCAGIQCAATEHEIQSYNTMTQNGAQPLPEPEAHIRVAARSTMPYSSSAEHGEGESTVKVDAVAPHNITLTGLVSKGEGEVQLGEVEAHLKVEATDAGSGVGKIAVGIDGKEIGKAGGSCSLSPCTAGSEWSLNGAEIGSGAHTLTVVATDNAGNIEVKPYALNVNHAAPVAIGPGSVNPESGDFALEAADVELSGGMGPLSVTRHYDSLNPKEDEDGPLGPQWTIGLNSLASLEVLPDESVMVVGPEGLTHFPVKEGGGFEAPEGDKNLTLEYEPKTPAYLLKNPAQGTTTQFTLPKGGSAWLPTVSDGPVATDTTTAEYTTAEVEGKTIAEPTLELAPHPAATCAKGKLEAGCRALEFAYGTETKAKGEKRTEWGEFKGRLKEVIAVAYNPSTKAMARTPVAAYEYDGHGRLRTEWNPAISPAVKTTYGYDSEGQVTSLTPPGQESWAFTYGAIGGDASTGRLLKVTRAPASGALWNGEATTNTAAPKLSGTPAVGVRMAVSEGTWSNAPVAYGFQWEDCNSVGKECTPILGASNANYTPVSADVGHTLVAEVVATNGDGSGEVSSAASAPVGFKAGSYSQTVDIGSSLNSVSCVPGTADCVISDSKGKALYATNVSSSSAATWNSWSGPTGQSPSQAVACPSASLCLLADGKESAGGNLYYATSFGGAWSEAYAPSTGVDAIACASAAFCVDGQDSGGYFRYATSPGSKSWTLEQQGSTSMKGAFCLSSSFCALADGTGHVHIANSTAQIESSSWKETDVDGTSKLNGIACTSTTSCVAVDGAGNVISLTIEGSGNAIAAKHDIDGSTSLTAVACTTSATCVTVDVAGNVFVSKAGGEWTKPYALGDNLTSVACASATLCVAGDTIGKVTAFSTSAEVSEGAVISPQPGSTIEYGVPLSGNGAPQEMGAKAVEEGWAQKDDPAYATAIFPPGKAVGWPAPNYSRATVYYLDSEARTVNVAAPSGGITTTEYNDQNEVTRALSADNRAAAINEGGKSAEVAERLDTKTEYDPATGDITKVVGPKHKVKLASGEEVEAQSITHDYYNEGAEQAEAQNHEEYDLLTKTTSGALLSNGEEKDVRTTATSYSGQNYLGWTLRKPTSTTTDPTGLDLVRKTIYDKNTGNVVETRKPVGSSETVYPPAFASAFASEGSGNGQLNRPEGTAIDSSGNVLVADFYNGRIEKFSPSGAFLTTCGTWGTGNAQFREPDGIAINQSTGNIYVADTGNNRIEVLTASCAYVTSFSATGSGALSGPIGIVLDSSGDVWVSDHGHNHLVEFSAEGTLIREVGSAGSGNGQLSGPEGIAISEGSIFVVDAGNYRVEQFSSTGAYLGQFGAKGSGAGQLEGPSWIAANPSSGNLYVSDTAGHRLEEWSPAGRFLTEWGTWGATHELSFPVGITIGATGTLYIADKWGNKVSSWTSPEAGAADLSPASQIGSAGTGEGQLKYPHGVAIDGEGNRWVADSGNNRIEKFSPKVGFVAAYGKEGSGNGEFKNPWAIDVNQSTGNVYVSDANNHRVEEVSSSLAFIRVFGTEGVCKLSEPGGLKVDSAGNVWVPDMSADKIIEFSSTGTCIAAYGKEGSGPGDFKRPSAIAISGENVYVTDTLNHRVQEISNKGASIRSFGINGSGSGELKEPEGIAVDSAGNLYVVDEPAGHVEEFSPTGAYRATFASSGSGEGQLKDPTGDAIDAAGGLYVADTLNNRVARWTSVNQAAHDTKTIYYTAKGEAEVERCQNHPEWVGLPCETAPGAQPHTSGLELPELPVTVTEYNMWNQPEVIQETFGTGAQAKTRTKKTTYDAGDRPEVTEETSSVDLPLPKVKEKYSAETGNLIEQSTTVGETTKTITSAYNTLGRLTEYTDAAGNKATFEYEKEKDARLVKVADAKGSRTYHYAEATGNLAEVVDSAAGAFKPTYDVEGKMTSESYPNAMAANFARNPAGEATGIEYIKTAHCAKTCPEVWFSDATVPSIHGEVVRQVSTLAEEPSETYDAAGRLTQVQEVPAGEGCTTRRYSYDEEGNRTSLTTNAPGAEGKCTSEGGSTEGHTYDPANRMIDSGVAYETFGNTTKLPAADAGGSELVSEYYVDNQVAKQEQNNETIEYKLDPEDRALETISKGNSSATVISHYDGAGNALAWTGEGSGEAEKWTRHIPDIGGALTALQAGEGKTGKAVALQLHDLKGDIVGEALDNEAETKLVKTYNSTEFGVPSGKAPPPQYAWLGAAGVASELPSGVIAQDGATYVPQTGQPLQTQPVELPLPTNSGNPYVKENADGAEWGATAGALRIAEYWKAQSAQGTPPIGGSVMLEGGCSGGGACAAAYNACGLHWLFGEPNAGELWLAAGVGCTHPVAHIQVEACFWAWTTSGSSEDLKNYHQFGCATETASKTKGEGVIIRAECAEGETYRAWVWGRAWGSNFWFGTGGIVSSTWQCDDAGYGIEREYLEYKLEK